MLDILKKILDEIGLLEFWRGLSLPSKLGISFGIMCLDAALGAYFTSSQFFDDDFVISHMPELILSMWLYIATLTLMGVMTAVWMYRSRPGGFLRFIVILPPAANVGVCFMMMPFPFSLLSGSMPFLLIFWTMFYRSGKFGAVLGKLLGILCILMGLFSAWQAFSFVGNMGDMTPLLFISALIRWITGAYFIKDARSSTQS